MFNPIDILLNMLLFILLRITTTTTPTLHYTGQPSPIHRSVEPYHFPSFSLVYSLVELCTPIMLYIHTRWQ